MDRPASFLDFVVGQCAMLGSVLASASRDGGDSSPFKESVAPNPAGVAFLVLCRCGVIVCDFSCVSRAAIVALCLPTRLSDERHMHALIVGLHHEVSGFLFFTTPLVMWKLCQMDHWWSALFYPFAILWCVGWVGLRIEA